MAVLLIKDKKELIVSCSCGCEDSFHLTIDCDDDTDYARSEERRVGKECRL